MRKDLATYRRWFIRFITDNVVNKFKLISLHSLSVIFQSKVLTLQYKANHNNLSIFISSYTSYLVSVTYFGHWNVASITEWCDRKIKLAFSITLAVKFFASSDRPQPGNIPISTGAGKTINKHYSYICILVFYKCYFSAALLGNVRAFKRNLQHKMPVNALWHF